MRVANKTIYDLITFRLGNVTEELQKANEVVATGKRINSLSDDPVGLTQALNIKSSLSNIDQLHRNINVGKTWLTVTESALSQVQNLISDTKVLCVQMANATMGADERRSAAEIVQNTLEEMVSLANTDVGGRYVFAGSKTDAAAFSRGGDNTVTYNGDNNPFTVKMGRNSTVKIGQDGEDVFWEQSITVDSSNNKIDFIEYLGASPGSELTATIASGTYTHDKLAAAIKSAMESASDASGNNIDYEVTYDSTTKKFTIRDDGATSGAHLKLLWDTGTNADTSSIAPDIGFGAVDVRDALISDNTVTIFTIDGTNDTIDFKEDTGSGLTSLSASIANADYASGAALATAVETAMDAESIANGNGIDYEVTYDATNQKFIIEEDGTDLQQLQILWNSGAATTQAAATALGFDNATDDIHAPPTSNNQVEWGIFKTLKDLENYLETNDASGIARSIGRLDTHFDHISGKISDIGSKMLRVEIKENIFQETYITNTERLSNIEDADIAGAIIDLKAKEVAYQAALASSARVMQLSLVDYL